MAEETYYDPAKWALIKDPLPGAAALISGYARHINVPIALVLGHLEKLTTNELEEVRVDINAEITRRNGRPG